MNNSLFIDPQHEVELQREGVVALPFLTEEELHTIQAFYIELHGDNDPPAMYDGIHMTIWSPDLDYKLRVKNTLEALLAPAFERLFKDYRPVSQQFIVKRKGSDTTFPVHQDWSIVDETKYRSFNLWLPLQDVNETNGGMWVVKRSHNINRKIRGAGILFPDFKPILSEMRPFMTSFPLKAGEVLLFYPSTIHGSPANVSDDPRIAVQVSILPNEAPYYIYFQKNTESPLEAYSPADDFTYYYDKLREDSEMRPPIETPVTILPSFHQSLPSLQEVSEAINS